MRNRRGKARREEERAARGRIMGAEIATTVYAVSRGCFNEFQTASSRNGRRGAEGNGFKSIAAARLTCRENRSEYRCVRLFPLKVF